MAVARHMIVIDQNRSTPARKTAFQLACSSAASRIRKLIAIDIETREVVASALHIALSRLRCILAPYGGTHRLLVVRIQHLVPASDSGDDFVGVGGPDEGF